MVQKKDETEALLVGNREASSQPDASAPKNFVDDVKAALKSLGNISELSTSELRRLRFARLHPSTKALPGPSGLGTALDALLNEGIDALRPGGEEKPSDAAWRSYFILHRRYRANPKLTPALICDSLNIGERAYYKAHREAIEELSSWFLKQEAESQPIEVQANAASHASLRLELDQIILRGHTYFINKVSWAKETGKLISCSGDRRAILWDLSTRKIAQKFIHDAAWVASAAATADYAVTVDGKGSLRVWPLGNDSLPNVTMAQAHDGECRTMALAPDGSWCLTGGSDKLVRQWTLPGLRCIANLRGHTTGVRGVAIAPDAQKFASIDDDGRAFVWSEDEGYCVFDVDGVDIGNAVEFSNDGRFLAAAYLSGRIVLWDLVQNRWAWEGEDPSRYGHEGNAKGLAFAPDGKHLITCGQDGAIKTWTMSGGICIHSLRGHTDMVNSVAFSPDGRLLASGSRDATVRLWEMNDLGLG